MATDHCWNWQVGSERCNFTALCGTFLLFKRPSSQLHLFSSSRSFSILSYPLFSTLRPLALHSAHRENITLMWYDMCVPTVYSCKKNCSCHVFFSLFFLVHDSPGGQSGPEQDCSASSIFFFHIDTSDLKSVWTGRHRNIQKHQQLFSYTNIFKRGCKSAPGIIIVI